MALPAKQSNELRRTVALKILVQVFRKGKMRKSTQNERIYQFYHGDAAARISSRVNMLVHGEDIYADLYDTKVEVVTDDDDDRLPPTKLCLKREYHRSNRTFIAGSDITVLALERNVFTKNSTLVTGRTLQPSGNDAHANVKKAFSHALILIKRDGSPKESGDKRPDLEKKVLDWMFNKLKGKYSVVGPGEEPEEEEAADEAEAAADDTETPPSKGQHPVNWFFNGWYAFLLFGPFAPPDKQIDFIKLGDPKRVIQKWV
jgi:hypothetical protein